MSRKTDKYWQPVFKLVRLPKRKGPDKQGDVFCAAAIGNNEHIRNGDSDELALINGALGSNTKLTRQHIQRLVDELNSVWDRYMQGEFCP